MNSDIHSQLSEIEKESEIIGVISSPSSSNQIQIDILDNATTKKLVGSFCYFTFIQEDIPHIAFGQLTEVNLRNKWTEDPIMKGLIRHKGRLEPITKRQDTYTANLNIGAVLSITDPIKQSILGTIPETGTEIKFANEDIFSKLFKKYEDQLSYLGKIYATNCILPMWFKEFTKSETGIGEAYHIGIFGKTGSGKSYLAKMITCAYAKNKDMAIILFDPQGEFTKEYHENNSTFKKILEEKLNRSVEVINLHQIVLTGSLLFRKILINSDFFEAFSFAKSYPEIFERTANLFVDILEGKGSFKSKYGKEKIKPHYYYKMESFDRIWSEINDEQVQEMIYYSKEPRQRFVNKLKSQSFASLLEKWTKIGALFGYGERKKYFKLNEIADHILSEEKNKIFIIDLSKENTPEYLYWNPDIQLIIIDAILERLQNQAEIEFKNRKYLNTLVIIDEAHRLIPRFKSDNENLENIKIKLIDAVRTTRKYGLGWMFISQSLSSLDKEILKQLRAYFFGFGLAWGSELTSLQELIGGNFDAIKLYQSFRDPHSNLEKDGEYPFMSLGPVSPLSFSGSPLFFTALKYPKEFIDNNF